MSISNFKYFVKHYYNIFSHWADFIVDILTGINYTYNSCKAPTKHLTEGSSKMSELKKVLMERDGMTEEEANAEIVDMRNRVYEGENPEEVLYDIGLEPDYIFDIIG